jgi:hypothetical protein
MDGPPSFADPTNLEPKTEHEAIKLDPNGTSLNLLQAIYRSATLPLPVRMRAAGMALQFEHPKLGVSLNLPWNEDFADRLARAVERSSRVMIDQQPTNIIEQPSVPDRSFRRV